MANYLIPVSALPGLVVTLCASVWSAETNAGTQVVANGSARVYAGAGYSPNAVDQIDITVPGANVGNSTAVYGRENGTQTTTLIDAWARAPRRNSRTVLWTVDSSTPMRCATPASCGGTTIPMKQFGFSVVSGNEIASAAFNGTANQRLAAFRTSRYVYTYQRFYYLNDTVYPAGRYTGRVVYTVSMP